MSGNNFRGLFLIPLLAVAIGGCGSSNSSGEGGKSSTEGTNGSGASSPTGSGQGVGGSVSTAGGSTISTSSDGVGGAGGANPATGTSMAGVGGAGAGTTTGTASGTGGSMMMGACTDAADEAATANMTKVSNAANSCGENCFTDTSQCAPCMKMKLGLTTACSVCWGNVIACGANMCLSQCISDPNSAACMNCNNTKCEPAFDMCAGTN